MKPDFNITVLASGGGGNLQALIDNQESEGYKINMVITDRLCYALDRAKNSGIANHLILKMESRNAFYALIDEVIPADTNLIILAGFIPILNEVFCNKWEGKIINTHPSLLPKYGGKGMIGVKVQEAVMAAGEEYGGCTVHYVNSAIDSGKIILQKAVKVNYDETPWQLGGRIHEEENKLLIEVIKLIKNQNHV